MFIVLLTKKFEQIMYFVIKTDNTVLSLFSQFLKNIESVKMKTISKSLTRNTSCSENIVPWIPIKAGVYLIQLQKINFGIFAYKASLASK